MFQKQTKIIVSILETTKYTIYSLLGELSPHQNQIVIT